MFESTKSQDESCNNHQGRASFHSTQNFAATNSVRAQSVDQLWVFFSLHSSWNCVKLSYLAPKLPRAFFTAASPRTMGRRGKVAHQSVRKPTIVRVKFGYLDPSQFLFLWFLGFSPRTSPLFSSRHFSFSFSFFFLGLIKSAARQQTKNMTGKKTFARLKLRETAARRNKGRIKKRSQKLPVCVCVHVSVTSSATVYTSYIWLYLAT